MFDSSDDPKAPRRDGLHTDIGGRATRIKSNRNGAYAEDFDPGTLVFWPEPPVCGAERGTRWIAPSPMGKVVFVSGGVAFVRFSDGEPLPVIRGQLCTRY